MKPWKWTINTKLTSIRSIYLITNNSSEDPCQLDPFSMATAASIYTVSSTGRRASADFRPTAMIGCPLQHDAFIQYSELLVPARANPGQLQGLSMRDFFLDPADIIRSWRQCFSYIPLWELSHNKYYKWTWNHSLGYKSKP